jgi:hypothetical protein
MSDDRSKRNSMSLEEATVSAMWEIAAIVEVLERKGLSRSKTSTTSSQSSSRESPHQHSCNRLP